ncbi:MAG: histidine kinase [Rubripirellula sp.]|nr:histidine kinase [Rubripirellula sp.]
MRIVTTLALFFCVLPVMAGEREADADRSAPGLQHRIARWIRPSIREDVRALTTLDTLLEKLPPFSPGRRGASAGYHSRFYDSAEETIDIVLDLGESRAIDRVAVFSVSAVFQGENIAGYGFPRRFRIEIADDSSFEQAELLLDSTSTAPLIRREFPVQAVTPEVSGRFLRLRVLEHWQRSDERYLTALGEIMVLSGGRNVAIGASVDGDSFTSLPDWSRENLVDGQTDLGLPIGPEQSSSNGFLSKAQPEPVSQKWVQLELARPARIEEVRLIPAEPFDAPSQHGHGFPRRFRVVASLTSDFTSPHVIADHTEIAFPNPGDNAVILPASEVTAKFIRLEVEELWHISNGTYSLALAEMQVYQHGHNIATGATITASDVFAKKPFDRVWKPEFLVDGYSSQNQLIGLDQWLSGLAQRAELEWKIESTQTRLQRTVEGTTTALLFLAAGLIAALVALTVNTLVRRKRALARQRDEMRTRIARDLHDDLGSRLGGMRLISESMLADSELPSSMHGDLALIHRGSREATDAMRDIVWLLDNSEISRSKLVAHIRQVTPSILGGLQCEFTVDEAPEQALDFDFRRQILFALKECLANVTKHANAQRVQCHIGGGANRFTFEVSDDGKGYDTEKTGGGHGLNNLRSRADALDGELAVFSRPGEGTHVLFDAPVRISRT